MLCIFLVFGAYRNGWVCALGNRIVFLLDGGRFGVTDGKYGVKEGQKIVISIFICHGWGCFLKVGVKMLIGYILLTFPCPTLSYRTILPHRIRRLEICHSCSLLPLMKTEMKVSNGSSYV